VIQRAALAIGAGTLIAGPSAAASLAILPSPFDSLRDVPPLRASAAPTETRFRGRLASTQVVRVSIDRTGRPFRIVDIDRMIITAKGDYSFVIGGPVEDARAVSGSGSEPGLRSNAVVWQGFSPGRRVLAAAIILEQSRAAAALPLRVEIGPHGVRLTNATTATVTTIDAPVRAAEIAGLLDTMRAALKASTPTPAPVVTANGPVRSVRVVAQVPLRVRGTIRLAGKPRRHFVLVLRGRSVQIAGAGAVKALELRVAVPDAATLLSPPRARRWVDLARSGRFPDGRRATRVAVHRLLTAGLASQFGRFLTNPDANGSSRTSYRYVLAPRTRAQAADEPGGGDRWLLTVGAALALVLAAAGALVLWAHS
jgi:hypothetical protein